MQKHNRMRPIVLMMSLLLCISPLASCTAETGTTDPTGTETDRQTDKEAESMTEIQTEAVSETTEEITQAPDTEPATLPLTEPETGAPTEPETEPETETDPPRLSLGVDIDPYIPAEPAPVKNVKAMWLSQFDMNKVYTDGSRQRDEEDFRSRIGVVLDNVLSCGFNTVIVQVRPYADSMVPSDYFPPSKFVTGSYAVGFTYDPFAILVQEAKYRGLDVHAWINPLRGMSDAEIRQVSSSYPIRQWYDDSELRGKYIVNINNAWYLNPAYAEVRKLIVDGARELMQNYPIDGVHMDDYFYPTQDASFDEAAYEAYRAEGGRKKLDAFRRDNLSDLVSDLYRAVKAERADAWFGISPAGIYTTVMNKHYADVTRWCGNPGFIDYIIPQVYFGFEHATCAFDKICMQWQNLIKTDYVTLLVGVSFGKALSKTDAYAGSGKDEWAQHTDILKRGVEYSLHLDKCQGMSVFCYQYFWDPVSAVPVSGTKAERDNFLSVFREAEWQ